MATFEELRSDKALVGKREMHSSAGGAIIWFVILADGHMLDCGTDQRRAERVASALNLLPAGERP